MVKPKNTVVIPKTVDTKHDEEMVKMNNDTEIVKPVLEEEKRTMIARIEASGNTKTPEQSARLDAINKKLKQINKAQTEYLLNNSLNLFNYFEQKKNIAKCDNPITHLNDFFSKLTPTSTLEDSLYSLNKPKYDVKSTFDINKYTYNIDNCMYCKVGSLLQIEQEGMLICNKCFKYNTILIGEETSSYKEPPKEICFYAYKRINHFREILAQFQAKETTQIPEEIIVNILKQIKKERISLNAFTDTRAKDILKKLGYNKFYEHIPFIKDKLGIKPPIMPPELELKLCNLFIEIQAPYSKCCPDKRTNFLNYYYTIYKLCELLEQNQFLPYFPMLKDRDKRIEQDVIWKNICKEMDWEFIPTI